MDDLNMLGRGARVESITDKIKTGRGQTEPELPFAKHRAASVTSFRSAPLQRRHTDLSRNNSTQHNDGLDQTVELFDRALFVLNKDGYVLRANEMARDLIASGTVRQSVEGHFIAGDHDAQASLNAALQAFSKSDVSTSRFHRPIGDGHWLIFDLRKVDDVSKDDLTPSEIVLKIRSTGDDAPRGAWTATVRSLRLTPCEADVAMCIFSALSAKEIAQRLNVSPNTVKSHLRSIYAKAGCAGYSETLRLLLSLTRP